MFKGRSKEVALAWCMQTLLQQAHFLRETDESIQSKNHVTSSAAGLLDFTYQALNVTLWSIHSWGTEPLRERNAEGTADQPQLKHLP